MQIVIKLFFTLFFSCTACYAQNYRFEVSQVSLSVKQNGKWSEFTPFKPANIVAVLDTKKNYISVYSEIEQYFKILKYQDPVTDNGKEIVSFMCINQELENCILEIHTNQNTNKTQLYLNFKDRIIVYNMKYIKK